MPIWLQIVCALSAGLVSALLGIALVPFLRKVRAFPPDAPKGETLTDEERRPIMGGLLLLAGILFALVLSGTLWLQCSGADRTSDAFSEQLRKFAAPAGYAGILCGIGIISDILIVRGRYNRMLWDYIVPPMVLMAAMVSVGYLGFTEAELTSNHWLVLLPLPACICFALEYLVERDTDGAGITVNAVEFLLLTILLLRKSLYLPSLLTLAAAGACIGCMVWCLHPAKCRIGKTGKFLLGGLLPQICLVCGMYKELALFMAVFLLQELYPKWTRGDKYFTEALAGGRIQPLGQIAILAGIAALCGVIALL